MKKFMKVATIAIMCAALSGCYTLNHQVGDGANGANSVKKKQWYILWGLVPINSVDSKAMAGGAENYTIQSQQAIDDIIIGLFTGWVTIYPQTVKVTK